MNGIFENAQKAVKDFISSREVLAVMGMADNQRYNEICRELKVMEQAANEVLNKLEKDDRITVRRYYEGETQKASHESDEIYLQGVKDCMSALMFFGALGAGNGCKK